MQSGAQMADLKLVQPGTIEINATKTHISEIEIKNPQYEQLLADVWVAIVLTLILLTCVCCMCFLLLYHKFQQWKRSVLRNNEEPDIGSPQGLTLDCESLPSYTMASGLPTYKEAIQQMKAEGKPFKTPEAIFKDDSNVSLQQGMTPPTDKVSVINYLQSFLPEKT